MIIYDYMRCHPLILNRINLDFKYFSLVTLQILNSHNGSRISYGKLSLKIVSSHFQKTPMNHQQPYRPVSTCPHTYGVRLLPCTAIATEPCSPTACVNEWSCSTAIHQPPANSSLLTANWTFIFSAKERDPETGLSYFGSRYYGSDLSVWLSVDPQSDKYASLSPYVYCADNPMRCVDPNGGTVIVTGADADSYVQGLNTRNLTFSRDESSSYTKKWTHRFF